MAQYQVKDPAGQLHVIEGPDGATPDQIMEQAQKLIPPDAGPDFGDVVKQAVNEAIAGNGTKIRSLMTDPITQAKALPYLAGGALSVLGVPGGATAGTGGGHLLADAALKSYGREDQIPSAGSQILDTGLAAAGDITAIPAINKKIFGRQIGMAEKAAGVPPPQEIPSLPRPGGTEAVSNAIDDAVKSVSTSGGSGTPTYWKQIKDQVDWLYQRGKDMALSPLDRGKLQWLNGQVQSGLNASVPGRAAPAASLAVSQAVPDVISSAIRKTPGWAKIAIAGGVTGGIGSKLMDALGSRR